MRNILGGLALLLTSFSTFSQLSADSLMQVICSSKSDSLRISATMDLICTFGYLETWTNHSPFWMLAIFMCIGAMLVPIHHRLEKWITHQLVEKNKRIRLAAAKKTIATLED